MGQKKRKFLSHKDENLSSLFFFHDPFVVIEKRKEGPEAMPKFLIVMCICDIFATVTVLWGTYLVPWCI